MPPRHATAYAWPAAGTGAVSGRRALAVRYLAIAVAGNRRLDIDFGRLEGATVQTLPPRELICVKLAG